MLWKRCWWAVAVLLLGLGCAHAPDRATRPWKPPILDRLPRCEPVQGAVSVGEVLGRKVGERVVVRGNLAHGEWACTDRTCLDKNRKPERCCNDCSTKLMLVDPSGGDGRVFLQLEGTGSMLGIEAQDCERELLVESALARAFIAAGVVAEPTEVPGVGAALLSDVRLCRAGD